MANKFISHSLKERNLKNSEGERTVEVSEDVLKQLHSVHYFSKKKAKALFILSASKELGTIKRKRKKSIREFNPIEGEEEKIEYKPKRMKQNDEGNKELQNGCSQNLRKRIRRKKKKDKKEMSTNH